MIISNVTVEKEFLLKISTKDGRKGYFDVKPYLEYEAFQELKSPNSFKNIINGGYYIEWANGADLSADTIEKYFVND